MRDKDKVCAAGLLDLRARCRVKIKVLGKAGCVRKLPGIKAHSVVEPGLYIAGAVRCGSVKIADGKRERLDAAFEIRTDRAAEHTKNIFIRRLHAECRARAHCKRADIKRRTGAVWRDGVLIGSDSHIYCPDKHLGAYLRDEHSAA